MSTRTHIVSLSLLSVDASSSSRLVCRTGCIATIHTCARRMPRNPLAAARQTLSLAKERRSTLFAHRRVPRPSLHDCPWQSLTTRLSAPPTEASWRTAMALRVSCTPSPSRFTSRAHWASWVPFVGLRPSCLDGSFPCFAQALLPGNSLKYVVATNVFHLLAPCLGAQLGVEPSTFVVPNASLPTD